LIEALKDHRLTDTHRFLIEHCLQHMAFLEQSIEQLEGRILKQINQANLTRSFELLQTVPAIKQAAAAAVLAEIGSSMEPFPSPGQLASWASLCPGNTEAPINHWAQIAPREISGSEPRWRNVHGRHPCRMFPSFRLASNDLCLASADARRSLWWHTPCL
jgi:transposase IS116/IS110/IS902 family protein